MVRRRPNPRSSVCPTPGSPAGWPRAARDAWMADSRSAEAGHTHRAPRMPTGHRLASWCPVRTAPTWRRSCVSCPRPKCGCATPGTRPACAVPQVKHCWPKRCSCRNTARSHSARWRPDGYRTVTPGITCRWLRWPPCFSWGRCSVSVRRPRTWCFKRLRRSRCPTHLCPPE